MKKKEAEPKSLFSRPLQVCTSIAKTTDRKTVVLVVVVPVHGRIIVVQISVPRIVAVVLRR